MTKKIRSMFFVLALIMLLVTVGAVCAADDTNSTNTASDSSVSDAITIDTASDTVVAEPIITTSNDNKVDTKTIEKKKNVKTATKTVEVNNYNELTDTINNAVNDANNDEYIINLNKGTYQTSIVRYNRGNKQPNIIINGNNQVLNSTRYVRFNNGCNLTITDVTIVHDLQNYGNNIVLKNDNLYGITIENNNNLNIIMENCSIITYVTPNGATYSSNLRNYGNMTLKNVTLNSSITNNGNLTICDDVIFEEGCTINSAGILIINDTNRITPYINTYYGDNTLENMIITTSKTNNGNLTLKNVTINSSIENNGNLTICDDVTFGENCVIYGNGPIIINDTNKIIPYLGTYNGNYTLENMNITSGKTNNGNLTLKNSIINNMITNYGNLTLINTTVNSDLWTYGTIFVGENVTVNNSNVYIRLFNDGTIIANDTSILSPYIDYIINGNYTIKDSVITRSKTNNANLTISNSTIKSQLTNNGNLTINTSNISIEGYNPQISNNGNLTIINTTINSTVINNQNINIINSMINAILENNQNATLENSTINETISNNGNLTIADDVIFAENAKIEGTGNITINDTSKITPYMDSYPNGNYTIKDVIITKPKTNDGNLTVINATLNNQITNNNNIFIENSIINATISNNGNLTIADDVILTENAKIVGTGNITINDTSKIVPYLDIYPNGDYLIKDVVINTFKTNYANLTIINSTINGVIDNYGNLVLDNCTLNNIVINKGNLTIGDNVIFGENFKLYSTGEIITNNSDRINQYLEPYNLSYNEVTDYNSFINIFRSSANDMTNDLYIINVLDGNYWFDYYIDVQINNMGTVKKIIIEGNNQTFNGSNAWIRYINMENFIINNLTLDKVGFRTDGLNSRLEINNSVINSTIVNVNGTLIIDDETIIDSYAKFSYNNVSINDIYRILPYTTEINSNISIENFTFTNQITFNANTLLSNCTINNSITNYGNLTLNDSNLNKTINNYGNITILNCSVNENTFRITNNGNVTCDDLAKYLPYITYIKGEYILNDYTINKTFTNNGQITANNCTFNSTITNNGQITANNSILNSSIMNNGVLIINDETIIGENFILNGNGEIIINDTNKIAPYLTTYNGNYTVENITITTIKTNNGNLTIRNSTINSRITNNGNMTITDSTVNSRIRNNANLTITDDCIIGENCQITGNGQLIMNNTARIGIYSGNNIINNTTLNKTITIPNDGNFTANNCNITASMTNSGNLTLNNCNITASMTNSGNLTLNNCNITDIIGNYGNLIMNNCSFSNNHMVTYLSSGMSNSGFLLNNNANASLINCIMENNTFNASGFIGSPPLLNGAIYNKGVLNIINCSFKNNSIGYSKVDDGAGALQGTNMGQGCVIFSNGTLSVYNSNFTNNYAGNSGGAIYSYSKVYTQNGNYYSFNDLMYINNSYFANNVAGLQGGAITFAGTGIIENSVFINNSEILNNNVIDNTGGGAIYSSGTNQTIKNCTFKENKAIREVTGLMFVETTGGAIRSTTYNITIDKSTFINNYATDGGSTLVIDTGRIMTQDVSVYITILQTKENRVMNSIFEYNLTNTSTNVIVGDANLINNTFTNINNTDYIIHTPINSEYEIENYNYVLSNNNITGNKFINNSVTDTIQYIITYDSITAGLTPEEVLEQNNRTTENNIYQNTTINDTLTLNIPNKIYTGEPITITGTYNLNNPSFYDSNILEQNKFNVYINGVLNQTVDELEFTVTPTVGTMMVTVQPTISQTRKTTAIRATTLSNIVITPENYNEYIYEGVLVGVGKDSKITFNGTFTNKEEIVLDTNDILIDGTNATFTNTIFILDAENITLQNMKINNTNTDYPIKNFKDNNIIINNTINLNNTNGKTAAIYNTASNTIISNNTIKVDGPAGDIDYETGSGICTTQAILLIGGDNNTIEYNNINITSSQAGTTFGTIEGITNSKNVTNTLIQYNTLNVSGGRFNYGINSLNNVKNITIAYNNITVTSERYTDGIQIGDGATDNLITNNNINLTCLNTTPVDEAAISYGVIITSQGGQISNNNTITQNNININGMVNYGMEIYSSTNTQITQNNITLNGAKSMGIGYDHSHNSTVTENKITINDDSTQPLNGITEEIQPLSTGIKVIDSENIVIENNSIKTNDKAKTDTTIDTESTNTTIKNNQLISSKGYGVDTIKTTQTDTTIENNTIKTITTFTVDKVAITNTNITLTATVNDEFENNINGGSISFTNGNEVIAQAEVIDGVATATVIFTEVQNTTIIASYTPASNRFATSSNKTTISIQEAQTILNIEEINLTAGETVTLTATVTDQTGNYINGGKVTFKVNGKTVKDTNGKVIYAKVVDGVATIEYTVPENLGGQDINITAVYSGTSKYNKETTTITTTVTAPETTLTITPITSDVQTGSTVTLKAKVAVGDKAITTGKIVFKINGKTVKDANGKVIYAKVDANGEVSVDYTIPESFKAGTYNIEAVFTASGYEKLTDNTTMTVVKS